MCGYNSYSVSYLYLTWPVLASSYNSIIIASFVIGRCWVWERIVSRRCSEIRSCTCVVYGHYISMATGLDLSTNAPSKDCTVYSALHWITIVSGKSQIAQQQQTDIQQLLGASFKRPLLSVDVFHGVCLCLCVGNFDAKYLGHLSFSGVFVQ